MNHAKTQRSDASSQQIERANYYHLVMDIAWFGLALPATSRFLSVYALRLGATPMDLGWLAALPAIVLMLSAALSSWWRTKFQDSITALFWPAFGFRLAFLLPLFAPLLPESWQIPWIVLSLSLPALTQGVAGVVFVAMMREAVDDQRLTPLVGQRAVAMNIAVAVSGLLLGVWLERAVFPYGYQVMFGVSFVLAMVSFWHMTRIKVPTLPPLVLLTQARMSSGPWRSAAFRRVALVLIVTHIPFLFAVPLIPLRLVDDLGAGESFLSLFALAELIAAALAGGASSALIQRYGSRAVLFWSTAGTAAGLLILAAASALGVTLLAAALMGGAWSSAAVAMFAYFTEQSPAGDMTRYSTAYHQAIFVATFAGPLLGSGLASSGLPVMAVLVVGAVLRLASAGAIHLIMPGPSFAAVLPEQIPARRSARAGGNPGR